MTADNAGPDTKRPNEQKTVLPVDIAELGGQLVDSHNAISAMLTAVQMGNGDAFDIAKLHTHSARARSAHELLDLGQQSWTVSSLQAIRTTNAVSLEKLTLIASSVERIAVALELMTAELKQRATAGGDPA